MKTKIVIKKPQREFRLLSFNVYDHFEESAQEEGDDGQRQQAQQLLDSLPG